MKWLTASQMGSVVKDIILAKADPEFKQLVKDYDGVWDQKSMIQYFGGVKRCPYIALIRKNFPSMEYTRYRNPFKNHTLPAWRLPNTFSEARYYQGMFKEWNGSSWVSADGLFDPLKTYKQVAQRLDWIMVIGKDKVEHLVQLDVRIEENIHYIGRGDIDQEIIDLSKWEIAMKVKI